MCFHRKSESIKTTSRQGCARSIFPTLANTFLTLSNTEKRCPIMREYIVPNRMNTDHDTQQIKPLVLRYIFFEEKLENVGIFFI